MSKCPCGLRGCIKPLAWVFNEVYAITYSFMSTVLLNSGSFYGTYGGHLFSGYLSLLFSGNVPFLSPQAVLGVWSAIGHFAQCGSDYRLQLVRVKSTCFNQSTFPGLWPQLIDQEVGI